MLENDNQQKEALFERDFQKQLGELELVEEGRLKSLKEELDLKLKVEVHEVEERKNLHINELIRNHQESFRELQDYYNTITSENLKVIRNHKVTIKKMNEEVAAIKKAIAEITAENNERRGPLKERQEEADRLRTLLR